MNLLTSYIFSINKKISTPKIFKNYCYLFIFFFFFFFQSLTLTTSYAFNYPDFSIDVPSEFSGDELNLTGRACANCEVTIFINEERYDSQRIQTPLRVINWSQEGSTIQLFPNQRFVINTSSDEVFELEVFGQSQTYQAGEMSGEYKITSIDQDGSRIVYSSGDNVFGGSSKNIRISDSMLDFYFDGITREDFISGENTIRVEVSGSDFDGSQSPILESFTIQVEKYRVQFSLDQDTRTVIGVEGGYLTGRVSGVEDFTRVGFAYLINGPGEIIPNVGLLRDFNVNQSNGRFNVTLRTNDFREGENTIDLIAYQAENKGSFEGFQRVEVVRDTIPPEITINRLNIFEGSGSNQRIVATFRGDEIGNQIFTGYPAFQLNISVDAQTLTWEYDSAPQEVTVIQNQVLLPITAKRGDRLVEDISNYLADGMEVDDVVKEMEISKRTVELVNEAFLKLQEDEIPRNKRWFEQVADDFGIGFDLILRAEDEAGNSALRSFTIVFNDEDPKIKLDEMEPRSVFQDEESFWGFERIQGRTNQPNVEISFVVIGPDDYLPRTQGDGQTSRIRISCNNLAQYHSQGIWRNFEDTSTLNENLEESEVTGSFALQFADVIEFIRGSLEFTSDERGRFGSSNRVSALVNNEFVQFRTHSDLSQRQGSHPNTLCAFTRNQFGRTNVQSITVNYRTGNYDWDVGPITFNRNSINPYEIESSTSAGDRYRTSLVVELTYTGQFSDDGTIDVTRTPRVNIRGEDARTIRVINSEIRHEFRDRRLLVYVPLEILPRNIPVSEYPNSQDLVLEILPQVSVQGYEVDNRNPAYAEFTLLYDTNLMTNWLTPRMIDRGISFLNQTKEFTGTLRDTTRKLVPIGVLTCTGARFWFSLQAAGLDENALHEEELFRLREQLFTICDRTFCSASPNECDERRLAQSDTLLSTQVDEEGRITGIEVPNDLSAFDTHLNDESGRILQTYDSLDVGAQCDVLGGRGMKGRIVNAQVSKFEEAGSFLFRADEAVSVSQTGNRCVPYTYSEEINAELERCEGLATAEDRIKCREDAYSNPSFILGLDVNTVSNACFSREAPRMDHTRCFGQAGFNPAESIIDSVACGCIPETYQHLNKLYKIQENMIECLEDVKSATVEGTYCERLISVSLCDAVTGVIFRLAGDRQVSSPAQRQYDSGQNQGVFGALLGSLQNTDNLMDDRYAGQSFYSSGRGFSTHSITNQLCLFAINRDFAQFEQAIIGDIDRSVQVAPEYAPTMPQTRFESFSPITGDMTISYRFVHNGVSGGSPVRFTYDLLCDRSRDNGEYCPEELIRASDVSPSLRTVSRTISGGGQAQETIAMRDTQATYVFNVLETVVEYSIGDEEKRRVHRETIRRSPGDQLQGGAFADCSFGLGGISCNRVFGSMSDITYFTFGQNSGIAPSQGNAGVFAPGEMVGVNVFYSARGDLSDAQRGRLWFRSSCGDIFGSVPLDQSLISSQNGNFYAELFPVPDLGSVAPQNNNENQEGENSNQQNTLREGNCRLELRMTGSGVQLSQDTFNLNILEDQGIQTDSQTQQRVNEIFTTNFIINSNRDTTPVFDIIRPQNNQVICVNDLGIPTNSNSIQVASLPSSVSAHAEIRLAQFAQDPIRFNLQNQGNFANLLVGNYLSGQFNNIDFTTQRSAVLTIRNSDNRDEILASRDISLRFC